MKHTSYLPLVLLLVLLITSLMVEARVCKPSGKLRGKKPPKGKCNKNNDSDCCEEGKKYATYKCSPPVSKRTKAFLTINSFEKGKDGDGPSECDHQYHNDTTPVVALSTGWFKFHNQKRCLNFITIRGNGRTTKARVVDECDSAAGCDSDHVINPRARVISLTPPRRFGKLWV